MAISKSFVKGTMSGNMGSMSFRDRGDDMVAAARSYTNSSKGAGASEAQRRHRCKLANLVNFYQSAPALFTRAYETKGRHQSDFNKFVSLNMVNSNALLTKKEAKLNVVVPQPFILTEGTLPAFEVSESAVSIPTGLDSPSSDMSVADFSTGVVSANPNLRIGDQLTFLSVDPITVTDSDGNSLPSCKLEVAELTLSTSDTTTIADHLGVLGSKYRFRLGGLEFSLKNVAGAVILSRVVNGKLAVSKTSLFVDHAATAFETYFSLAHIQQALDSYGYQGEVLLTPNK